MCSRLASPGSHHGVRCAVLAHLRRRPWPTSTHLAWQPWAQQSDLRVASTHDRGLCASKWTAGKLQLAPARTNQAAMNGTLQPEHCLVAGPTQKHVTGRAAVRRSSWSVCWLLAQLEKRQSLGPASCSSFNPVPCSIAARLPSTPPAPDHTPSRLVPACPGQYVSPQPALNSTPPLSATVPSSMPLLLPVPALRSTPNSPDPCCGAAALYSRTTVPCSVAARLPIFRMLRTARQSGPCISTCAYALWRRTCSHARASTAVHMPNRGTCPRTQPPHPACLHACTLHATLHACANPQGFMGPNYSISTGCATANYAFVAAANHIRAGGVGADGAGCVLLPCAVSGTTRTHA